VDGKGILGGYITSILYKGVGTSDFFSRKFLDELGDGREGKGQKGNESCAKTEGA